jgi:hypothetical protein
MLTSIQRRMAAPLARAKSPVAAGGGADQGGSSALGQDTFVRSQPPSGVAAKLTADQAAAYNQLNDAQRAMFDRVYLTCNRLAVGPLGKLLADGTLLKSRDLRNGGNLLLQLNRMATEPLAPGLNRTSLLSGMVTQAQDPGTISQGSRGTCTVTTVEYMLATKSPAEYARVMTDLATGDGSVTLADGTQAHRVPDSTATDDSGRSDVSRLFEAAMMQVGTGLLTYSDKTDKTGVGPYTFLPGGLGNRQVTRVANAVLDGHYRSDDAVPLIGEIPYTSVGGKRLMRDLEAALAKGERVPVGLDWRGEGEWKPAGHEVLALKVQDGRVYFRNPWGAYSAPGTEEGGKDSPRRRIEADGGIESMTIDEMQRRIKGISVE